MLRSLAGATALVKSAPDFQLHAVHQHADRSGLVVASFALIVAVPVLYPSSEDSGRSNRLILLGSAVWVALVLLNWGVSFFVV